MIDADVAWEKVWIFDTGIIVRETPGTTEQRERRELMGETADDDQERRIVIQSSNFIE